MKKAREVGKVKDEGQIFREELSTYYEKIWIYYTQQLEMALNKGRIKKEEYDIIKNHEMIQHVGCFSLLHEGYIGYPYVTSEQAMIVSMLLSVLNSIGANVDRFPDPPLPSFNSLNAYLSRLRDMKKVDGGLIPFLERERDFKNLMLSIR